MLGDLADACGRSSLFLMAASDAAEAIRTILRIQETKKQNKTAKKQKVSYLCYSICSYYVFRSIVRSSRWRCSIKKVLLKLSQNSQGNTCGSPRLSIGPFQKVQREVIYSPYVVRKNEKQP